MADTAEAGPETYFRIGGFDFGIEPDSRRVRIMESGGLAVDVRGSTAVMRGLFEDEREYLEAGGDEDADHPWNWTLHPPQFHVEGVAYANTNGSLRTGSELDPGSGLSEIAIYAFAHRRLDPFEITIKDGVVNASGIVIDLRPTPTPFEIAFAVELEGMPDPDGKTVEALRRYNAQHYSWESPG